jgi:hypothetical protein
MTHQAYKGAAPDSTERQNGASPEPCDSTPSTCDIASLHGATLPNLSEQELSGTEAVLALVKDHAAVIESSRPEILNHERIQSRIVDCMRFAASVTDGAFHTLIELSPQQTHTLGKIAEDPEAVRHGILAGLQ